MIRYQLKYQEGVFCLMNLADSTIHQAKPADYRHGWNMLRDSLKNSTILVPKRLSVLGRGRLYGPQHRKRDFLGVTHLYGWSHEWSAMEQITTGEGNAQESCFTMRKTCRRNEWRNVDKENSTLEKMCLGSAEDTRWTWRWHLARGKENYLENKKVHLPQNIEITFLFV